MKNKILAASIVSLLLAIPAISSADPWKDESGHDRKRHEHKHDHKERHKHKDKDKHDKEVIYVYEERPPKEVVYVYKERPREEVVYVYDERPREEVIYIQEERPRQEVIYVPEPAPREEVVYAPAPPRESVHEVSTANTDVGIDRGTCNRDAVGSILGSVAGGVLGYQVGRKNGNKGVGMMVGAIAGAVIGNQIGKNMDSGDMQCTAQTLDHARDGQTITWRNPENGVDYEMTPVETYHKNNLQCRRYVAVAASGATREELDREACKQSDGHWEVSDLKNRL